MWLRLAQGPLQQATANRWARRPAWLSRRDPVLTPGAVRGGPSRTIESLQSLRQQRTRPSFPGRRRRPGDPYHKQGGSPILPPSGCPLRRPGPGLFLPYLVWYCANKLSDESKPRQQQRPVRVSVARTILKLVLHRREIEPHFGCRSACDRFPPLAGPHN